MRSLDQAVDVMAGADHLLLMMDYDGTIAPIVSDPDEAVAGDRALGVLEQLVHTADTDVVVISGRGREDLGRFLPVEGVRLIGGHGADDGELREVSEAEVAALLAVAEALEDIAAEAQGAMVEIKPTSVAFHVRGVDREDAERLLTLAEKGPGRLPGVRAIPGKQVLDFTVAEEDKGTAVRLLRERAPEGVAVFIGDDVTDEDGFKALQPPDFGVKVGEGSTAATVRLPDQRWVVPFLEAVVSARVTR